MNQDLVAMVMEINRRSVSAISNSDGKELAGMEGRGALLIQQLKEYGYSSESALLGGIVNLVDKLMMFTKECVARDYVASSNGRVSLSMPLADPEGAVALLTETFDPDELALIRYEITSEKGALLDQRRASLLRKAGYMETQIKLKSHATW
jgi:hypothetical protein